MSTPINDGGPAFPSTLRDWFAGQALSGICANSTFLIETHADNWGEKVKLLAVDAYTTADAMLAAREVKP